MPPLKNNITEVLLHLGYIISHLKCFVNSHYKFLKRITGLDNVKLYERYNLKITDINGIEINEQRLEELSDSFFEDEELYNLHGYIYDEILDELSIFVQKNIN